MDNYEEQLTQKISELFEDFQDNLYNETDDPSFPTMQKWKERFPHLQVKGTGIPIPQEISSQKEDNSCNVIEVLAMNGNDYLLYSSVSNSAADILLNKIINTAVTPIIKPYIDDKVKEANVENSKFEYSPTASRRNKNALHLHKAVDNKPFSVTSFSKEIEIKDSAHYMILQKNVAQKGKRSSLQRIVNSTNGTEVINDKLREDSYSPVYSSHIIKQRPVSEKHFIDPFPDPSKKKKKCKHFSRFKKIF